jgi:cell division protein FtsW
MLIFTQVSLKTFRILIVIGIGVATLGLLLKSYRVGRLKDFLYNLYYMLPDSVKTHLNWDFTTSNISYQLRQSMNAIHNGGIWGVGIGNGQIKMGFLSDVHTDFILAGIAEETGFMGVFLVICLLSFLVLRILRIAINIKTETERDYQYKLFVVGIAILISLETILNSLGIIGLLPLKGLPVPFVSYGGSSLIAFSIGVGMVLMISKKVKIGDRD